MSKYGIIYLLQPSYLVGTDRYKIGQSTNANLERIKSYSLGTKYFKVFKCIEFNEIENKLKREFKKLKNENKENKFKLISGTEYFKGNIIEMIDEFMTITKNISNISYDDKIFNCNKCKYSTDNINEFREHINDNKCKNENMWEKLKFNCETCQYSTNSKTNFESHRATNMCKNNRKNNVTEQVNENKILKLNNFDNLYEYKKNNYLKSDRFDASSAYLNHNSIFFFEDFKGLEFNFKILTPEIFKSLILYLLIL